MLSCLEKVYIPILLMKNQDSYKIYSLFHFREVIDNKLSLYYG